MKRYHLVIPEDEFDLIAQEAEARSVPVVVEIRRRLKIAAEFEKNEREGGETLLRRADGTETRVMFL